MNDAQAMMGAQVVETTTESSEPGYPSLMRRDRLERIANAERDRRAGRTDVAIASIGEPVEWPARAVLALARLENGDSESRRILEEGLDLWAREVGVGDLNVASVEDDDAEEMQIQLANFAEDAASMASSLDAPLEISELDRAFDEAEAEVESMHHVNDVAERVLMDEPIGFAELANDDLTPSEEGGAHSIPAVPDVMGLDAAFVEEVGPSSPSFEADFAVGSPADGRANEPNHDDASRQLILATLETWLQNLTRRREGRA